MHKDCSADFIEEKLKNFKRYKMAATERVAAVLVPIVFTESGCNIIFTKRLGELKHHGGEVSFPGGKHDSDDDSLMMTALRETYEEIGIEPAEVRVLGTLDDELSRWGHRVTPFVGLIENPQFKMQATEVDKIYSVPVSHLMRDDVYYTETWLRNNTKRLVHFYRYKDDIIWGLTAKITRKFMELMTR
ncbi:MAG: CoA pyrophosphatase [Deferribacterales bacterium]